MSEDSEQSDQSIEAAPEVSPEPESGAGFVSQTQHSEPQVATRVNPPQRVSEPYDDDLPNHVSQIGDAGVGSIFMCKSGTRYRLANREQAEGAVSWTKVN